MRHLIAIGLLACVAAAPVSPQERKASDGTPYPATQPTTATIPTLPVIGQALGQLPELAFRGKRVVSRSTSPDEVEKMKDGMKIVVPKGTNLRTEWFVKVRGCDVLGFDLDDTGRVVRCVMFFHNLTDTAFNKFKSVKNVDTLAVQSLTSSAGAIVVELEPVDW